MVMLILGGSIGVVIGAVWIGVVTHPDPGNLVQNMLLVTAIWAIWMSVGVWLFRMGRQDPNPTT